MVRRLVHSVPARIVQSVVGIWLFVEGSVAQGTSGLVMLAVGFVLIAASGADVSPVDAIADGKHAAPEAGDRQSGAPVSRAA